jgi:peptidoglycan/LPS O-acetylase OafA/YrhL
MPNMTSIPYRPAIDGLRAVAILPLLIFHLNHGWLPGGFVGVDVFFVISGYLITSLLLLEYEQGRFSMLKFYQRRIARLFPAFFMVAMATVLASCFLHTSHDFYETGVALMASALGLANVAFMRLGEAYFTPAVDAVPFLHCWSLSVEEQFYLFFPAIYRFVFLRARRWATPVLAVALITSFLLCLAFTSIAPLTAFYSLPTRSWEFLTGSLLASLRASWADDPRYRSPLALAGLVLILTSYFVIDEKMSFPGYLAVLPVAGTALVLGGRRSPADGWVERMLAWSPLVLIGRMSYSLYLWHWPIFSFIDYRFFLASPLFCLGLKIVLTAVLTVFSYLAIEKPGRAFLNRPAHRWLAFGGLAAAWLLIFVLSQTIQQTQYIDASIAQVYQGGRVFHPEAKGGSIVLLGDSNASMYGHTLKDLSGEADMKLTVLSSAYHDELPFPEGPQPPLWDACLATIQRDKPDFVILVSLWALKLAHDPQRLQWAVDRLAPSARHIVLITEPPILPGDAYREAIRQGFRPPFHENAHQRADRLAANARVKAIHGNGVIVLDIEPDFTAPDGSLVVFDSNCAYYYDDNCHLSKLGADRVKAELLKILTSSRVSSVAR